MRNDRSVGARRWGRRSRRLARRLRQELLEGRLLLAQTTGLFFDEPDASDGYVLFAPNTTDDTYLIDKQGNVVNQWQSDDTPGLLGYLVEDGSLLRAAAAASGGQGGNGVINAAGAGGRLERFDWDGNLTWSFDYGISDAGGDSRNHLQHHDIEPLPNGNILMIAWEFKTGAQAIAAGRNPATVGSRLFPDSIVEVQPDLVGGGGTIVWQWHVWDHLVQDFDPSKANFGVVADHPELINVNYTSIGDEGGGAADDWTHANGVDYNAELDQIALSSREFSEFWIIDHSTTTAQAAGHTGGNSGRGGDVLYRWGNPQAYGRGDESDRVFYYQHDAKWVTDDSPGAGNITVFNNGYGGPADPDVSSVVEITPPVNANGHYPTLAPAEAHGPSMPTWTYTAPVEDFSTIISGTQRLPNGNTLITFGVLGRFIEVTPSGEEVWKYVNPYIPGQTLGPQDPIPNLGIPTPGLDALLANFTFRAIHYSVQDVVQFTSQVRFSELMYHPPAAPPGSPYQADEFEFVEIENIGDTPFNLQGMKLTDAVSFVFPDVTLPAGAFAVVVENRTAFESRYGTGINVVGEYAGKLHDDGELIMLVDADGRAIHSFTYDDDWHPGTDGGGRSLVIVDENAKLAAWGEAVGWRPSTNAYGSPGEADPSEPPPGAATITGRHVFYNQSKYDGNTSGIDPADSSAIDTSKSAYLPGAGGPMTPASMTSYDKGINGVMLDITGSHGPLSLADFAFSMSGQGAAVNNTPSKWVSAPAPVGFTVLADTPSAGTDRVELIWANATIANRYLEVIVKGNDALGGNRTNAGLAASDVFFFGNRIGDTFTASPAATFTTSAADEIEVRGNIPAFNLPVTNILDFDKNGSLTAVDQLAARGNAGFQLGINISSPPPAPAARADAFDDCSDSAVAAALALADDSWTVALETASGGEMPPTRADESPPAVGFWEQLGEASDPRASIILGSLDAVDVALDLDEWLDEVIGHL